MFCRSLFVLLYFFFLPLCCLYFDLRILIIPLVSSNSSCNGLLESLHLSSMTIDHLCQSIIRDNPFITSQYTKFHSIQKNRCDLHIKYCFQKFTRVIQSYCLLDGFFFGVFFFFFFFFFLWLLFRGRLFLRFLHEWRVWRYQSGNQNQ